MKLDKDKPKETKTVDAGPPKYTKSVLKKGDKTNFPKKGDVVHCWYTGTLQDGTVFDTNIQTSKSKCNLIFLALRHYKILVDELLAVSFCWLSLFSRSLLHLSCTWKRSLQFTAYWLGK